MAIVRVSKDVRLQRVKGGRAYTECTEGKGKTCEFPEGKGGT